jgi:hypothetical protein
MQPVPFIEHTPEKENLFLAIIRSQKQNVLSVMGITFIFYADIF